MEVAPVDADAIAGTIEDGLIACADVEHRKSAGMGTRPRHLLRGIVDGDGWVDIEQQIDVMRLAVRGDRAPREIGDRARKHIEVFGKERSEEGDAQLQASGGEAVPRMQRRHFDGLLLHGFHFRQLEPAHLPSHPAKGLAVDARQPGKGLRRLRPMLRGAIGELVGHRPQAERRIVRDQRNRRRPMLLGQRSRTNRESQHKG